MNYLFLFFAFKFNLFFLFAFFKYILNNWLSDFCNGFFLTVTCSGSKYEPEMPFCNSRFFRFWRVGYILKRVHQLHTNYAQTYVLFLLQKYSLHANRHMVGFKGHQNYDPVSFSFTSRCLVSLHCSLAELKCIKFEFV